MCGVVVFCGFLCCLMIVIVIVIVVFCVVCFRFRFFNMFLKCHGLDKNKLVKIQAGCEYSELFGTPDRSTRYTGISCKNAMFIL